MACRDCEAARQVVGEENVQCPTCDQEDDADA